MQDRVVKQQYYPVWLDLECLFVDELRYFLERTKTNQNISEHLLFPSLDGIRIERPSFEMREPQLGRGRLVAIRCTQYHLHIQVTDTLACLCTSVVRCTIHNNDDLLSPHSTILLCQCLSQP